MKKIIGAIETAKGFLSPQHDARVARLAELEAEQAAAEAKKQREIAATQAEVDEMDEPRRRLERQKAEATTASLRAARARAALEAELRQAPPRALQRFVARLDRVQDALRAGGRPQAETKYNAVTETQIVTNTDELERWRLIGPVLSRLHVEARDVLWRLPEAALRERIATLQAELDQALKDTILEATTA
jgi:hypothetical protein